MNPDTRYQDELSLLQDFRSGNMFALQTIYDMHYHAIWHFTNCFLKDRDQTGGIAAESFIKIWQERADFSNVKGIAYFLHTIARNACIIHLKKTGMLTY